jgi:dTDP-4-dehydrorhamnose reductase
MPPPGPLVLISPHGMLGRAWKALLDARGVAYRTASRPAFDLRNWATIAPAIPADTVAVINCAAWTDVDAAEQHEFEATLVNGDGVGALAHHCRTIGATLVHYSTDYVFDGVAETPYAVNHPRHPLNAYGRSKARGEELLEASRCEFLNIRTSWLYAPWGRNFVRTMAELVRHKPELRVVNDQRGRPTSAEHLARASLALLDKGVRGHRHVTDGGECTWYEFTVEINRRLGGNCNVQPCTTADFPRPARRPAYSVLDLSRTEKHIGPMPDWRDNLAQTLNHLEPTTV